MIYLFLLHNLLDYTIPASGDCFNFDEIEYQADPLPNFNPAASEITKLQASECLILPDGNSLYVALQLNLNENIPANSLLLFEIFGITNPSKTECKFISFDKNHKNLKM